MDKEAWRTALQKLDYTQKQQLEKFLNSYATGIDIGMPYHTPNVHAKNNPKMDLQSKCKMAQTILKWHNRGYLMGPYSMTHPLASECRINPVFCVPKPDGSVRPVVNYSKAINGSSLNELLDPSLCTVEYIQLKEIVYTIQQVGVGAMIWAKDLEDGYFNIKIKPEQATSIAFQFAGLLFIPMVLVFGLSSAPLIFTVFMWYAVMAIRFADNDLMWGIMPRSQFKRDLFQKEADIHYRQDMVQFPLVMYYLDDIFGVNRPALVHRQYTLAGKTLEVLGLSAKQSKDRPPATTQLLLGLEYDTVKQEVRIPQEKIIRYVSFARLLLTRKHVTKRELFSLTGKVRYAAIATKPLSCFARGVEVHGHDLKRWNHRINMTHRLKRDVNLIIEGLNHVGDRGVSFDFILRPRDCFDFVAYTDAASTIGLGGYINVKNAPYFQVKWQEITEYQSHDIQWKEMVAIAILLNTFKDKFANKCVNIWCDNEPVVWMLIRWHAPLHRKDLQHVLRFIAKICIFNNITPWWDHIKGHENKVADRLSRFLPNPFNFTEVTPTDTPSNFSARLSAQACADLC